MTARMAPYLLFGFAVAGAISAFLTPATVERHLGGRGIWPVIKASLLGVPLPLCSCGVIPVAASLREHGAGKGATLSFLISTPQTGVDSISVTYSLLGPVFALFRPVAAFVTGILGGAIADKLDPDGDPAPRPAAACKEGACCRRSGLGSKAMSGLRHGFFTLPADIAAPMSAGILIAGTVGALVPDDFFASYLGSGIIPMLVMLAVSIPVYVCASASVPIAAAMILKGLSPGAALVFLIAGPATNAATITTLWKTLGRRSVAIYILTVGSAAIVCGLLMDALNRTSLPEHAPAGYAHCQPHLGIASHAAAAILVTILVTASLISYFRNRE